MAGQPLRVQDLLAVLDGIAPFSLAESWDNVGLMVGDPDRELTGVLVALDPTMDVLSEARERGINTVITHHPPIFHPLTSVRTDRTEGRFLEKALAWEVAVVSCHTNFDLAVGGVNDLLASGLDLLNVRSLAAGGTDDPAAAAFGRLGDLPRPMPTALFLEFLRERLTLPVLRLAGFLPEMISTVGVCGGSGSELAEAAMLAGAQVYITGEVKHSAARWAVETGFLLVDAGHFETENIAIPGLVARLQKVFAAMGGPLQIMASERQISPFAYHMRSD